MTDTALFGNECKEEDSIEDVTELFLEFLVVAVPDDFKDFPGLFDEMG